MTGSQYKNIIEWSLYSSLSSVEDDLQIARRIFNNLGVSFPNGDHKTVCSSIKKNTFLGWRPVQPEDAQRYANAGFATIALNEEQVFVICPNNEVSNLSDNEKLGSAKSPSVSSVGEIFSDKGGGLLYYAYRYGFSFEKQQKSNEEKEGKKKI